MESLGAVEGKGYLAVGKLLSKSSWGEKPCGAKVEAKAEEFAHCWRSREARVGMTMMALRSLLAAGARMPGGGPVPGGTNSYSHHLFHTHKNHFRGVNDLSKLICFVHINHVSFKQTCALAQGQGYYHLAHKAH